MVIRGLVGDNLATMSFNEHNYVLKKNFIGTYSTFYYLGVDPKFGDYIEENDTLVVAGKLTERDLVVREETIYGGVSITKDIEYISKDDIKENTKYLKNIDVKTGECFSRLYVDGNICSFDKAKGLYSYSLDNSIVLVTPNLDKKDFNVFDLKKELLNFLSNFDQEELRSKLSVISVVDLNIVKNNVETNYFEIIIKFGDIDNIHISFMLDDNKLIKFFPFVYSEHFSKDYEISLGNGFISSDLFPYFFSRSELVILLDQLVNKDKETKREDKRLARIYVRNKIGNFETNYK